MAELLNKHLCIKACDGILTGACFKNDIYKENSDSTPNGMVIFAEVLPNKAGSPSICRDDYTKTFSLYPRCCSLLMSPNITQNGVMKYKAARTGHLEGLKHAWSNHKEFGLGSHRSVCQFLSMEVSQIGRLGSRFHHQKRWDGGIDLGNTHPGRIM